MANPLVSICIPTYNRDRFLQECLDSLTKQFADPDIRENVDIFILDNQSQDQTAEVAAKFAANFDTVTYIRDEQNRDIIRGIIKAASLADGEYVWVFSDDDLQAPDSLRTVVDFIRKNQPDIVFCNLAGFIEPGVIRQPDLLNVSADVILNGRRELFHFLNSKFYTSIDYYTTLCSNWILKKEIFDRHYPILEKFNGRLDLFPLPSLVFYADLDFRAGVIGKQIILNRGDNESWGKKNKIAQFWYRDEIWRDYYKKIAAQNKEFLPKGFLAKIRLKNLLRLKDLAKIIIGQVLRQLGIYERVKRLLKK